MPKLHPATEQVSHAATEHASQPISPREATLRALLPYDYEYAEKAGLIDMFYVDEAEGYDGLIHTLAGDVKTDKSGGYIPGGFHHEPSAGVVWPSVRGADGTTRPVTRVDRERLVELPGSRRRAYEEYPLEPFAAQVVIDGLRKFTMHTDPKTGERKLAPAKNSMYPNEYDALAVMQTIRIAKENRDPSQEVRKTAENGREFIVSDSSAPLMDGESSMRVRLVIDAETDKIITAMPLLPNKPGIMKLSEAEYNKHVYGT